MRISSAELHLAVKRGQTEELRRLLATGLACPNAIFNDWTLLGCAVSTQNTACVKILLEAGADASCPSAGLNGRLEPPLYTACRLKDEDTVDLLIKAGANLNCCDFYGHTPIWIAAKVQRPLLVAKLLEEGSVLGGKEFVWSQCPLYLITKYLSYYGRHQLACFIMAAGANPCLLDSKGRSAIYFTLRNGDHELLIFMLDSYNPNCWTTLLQKKVESLLSDLPSIILDQIKNLWYNPPTLAKMCRTVVRQNLLEQFNYRSLFLSVYKLPLPIFLQKFILFDQNLPQAEIIPCFMKK